MRTEDVTELLKETPGMSDREITDRLCGANQAQQPINGLCRRLTKKGLIVRRERSDGLLGNYLVDDSTSALGQILKPEYPRVLQLGEDQIKHKLEDHLISDGWAILGISWGKKQGIDIEAERGGERWLIEVKGIGSSPQMQGNYFLCVLGEILFRMTDPRAKYSIAIPDVRRFRNLWRQLPAEAKSRTRITALFVGESEVSEDVGCP